MFKVENITKDWKEAGSLQAHINLYGLWDEHSFLTKSGDLGSVLKIGGTDHESLDPAGTYYPDQRLVMAYRPLDYKTRLSEIPFKHNWATIPYTHNDLPL